MRGITVFALTMNIAVLALTTGCSSIQRPEIRAVRPRITGIDLQGVSLAFDVDVRNPYPVALRAPQFRYAIDIEDAEFAKADSPVSIDLAAAKVSTLTLPARFGYADLWKTYRHLTEAAEVKYRLRGTVPVSALGQSYELPLSHEGKLPVLRPPAIAVKNVDWSDVSLSRARVKVDSTLRNPNVFSLGLRDLGYALLLGDAPIGKLSATAAQDVAGGANGPLSLIGEVTAREALLKLLQGGGLSNVRVAPVGTIQTPYGAVPLGGAGAAGQPQ